MFVVARNSTLQFGDGQKTQKEIAGALGVKYLLTGSIRRQSKLLRIHTELTDVDRSRALWAERFDGIAGDIFEFQDRIVSSIVAALEPKVLSAEAAHLGARPTESLDAYDCVLRALSELYQVDGASYLRAKALLMRAVALDEGYAQAHAYLAWCLNFLIAEGRSDNVAMDRISAIQHARRSVDLDPEDAFNLSIRAHILGLHEDRPYEAVMMLHDALRLNPNIPLAWALSATNYAYLDDGVEARDRLLNVWQLTPYDPLNFFFWTAGGLAEFVEGEYDAATDLLQKARQAKPHFRASLRLLAASLALSGEESEARAVAAELLNEDPGFSITGFMAWYPLKSPETRERLIQGLLAAGLPQENSIAESVPAGTLRQDRIRDNY
jgi:tetratricopeptide (TPR) repeat protein